MRIAVLAFIFVTLGCATAPRITPEQATAVRKVALLSVSMDRLDPAPSGVQVQKASLDAAIDAFAGRMKEGGRFEFVDVRGAQIAQNFSFPTRSKSFADAASSGAEADPDLQMMQALMAMKGGKLNTDPSTLMLTALEQQLETRRATSVATETLAHVPVSALTANTGTTRFEYRNGKRVKTSEEARRDLVLTAAGNAARELGVDAVVLLHFRAEVGSSGPRVFVNDRGLATVKLGAGFVLVNANGETLVDVASPNLDGLAPQRLAVPAYRKTANAQEVDLADAKGAVQATLIEFAQTETAAVVGRLEKALSPEAKK
jgi:hypothetical protein